MTDSLSTLFEALAGERVHDVIVPGWMDRGYGHAQFVAWSSVVYLELDHGFLWLESDQGGLSLALVDLITVPPQLEEDDEEDAFAVASLGAMFMFDGGPTALTEVRYWTQHMPDDGRSFLRFVDFEVYGDIRLFVDPLWMPGLRLATGGFHDRSEEYLAHGQTVFGALEKHVISWPAGSS